jgi:putative ABC transport system permease protein
MVNALDRKLLRDLVLIKGQAIAIALVIAAGVSLYVLMLSTFDSLTLTQDTYYDRFRFADVFASLKRAPITLEQELREVPGVAAVRTRVVAGVTLDIEGMSEPAMGRLVSMPAVATPVLCDVFLRSGRYLDPARPDEVLVSETFAHEHGLAPGDGIVAIINGTRRSLEIVGLALSPEYVYNIRPGEMLPDERRFGILWMERKALATAFDLDGAFNDALLTLQPGASEHEVITRLDGLLSSYGGFGAYAREFQLSHFYLQNELKGLQGMGAIVPIIFLLVAAFLLNVVLSRIVSVQRSQIAALKAVGYSNRQVAWHYVKWGLVVALVGSALGIGCGALLGRGMTEMYTLFFHFPILEYRLDGGIVVQAIAISLAAAVLGALFAVRRAIRLQPADAMRPEAPELYRQTILERSRFARLLSQPTRIVLRTLSRHPGRAALSILGISAAAGMMVVGNFSLDAMDVMLDHQFNVAQLFDVMVSFVEPVSPRAEYELQRLPGVLDVERFRASPVRIRYQHRQRTTGITGLNNGARLNRVVDASFQVRSLPPGGLVLSAKLAELLQARVGDVVTVEFLTGARPVREIRVVALVDEFMGANAYMEIDTLARLLGEGPSLAGAYLSIDEAHAAELYQKLKDTPMVSGVLLKTAALESFEETLAEMIAMVRTTTVLFAAIMVFGVVYNSARISLSERSRELATLRVIGFTRAEIAYILLGEFILLAVLAIPIGMLVGYSLAAATVQAYDTELWRMPLVVAPATYAFSALTVIAATVVSAWIVRRKLHRLDLVEVLKTRE